MGNHQFLLRLWMWGIPPTRGSQSEGILHFIGQRQAELGAALSTRTLIALVPPADRANQVVVRKLVESLVGFSRQERGIPGKRLGRPVAVAGVTLMSAGPSG